MNAREPVPCLHCGEPEHLEVLEVFGNRDFLLDACCMASHEDAVDTLQDPLEGARLLKRLGIEDLLGSMLRRVCDVDGSLKLDWQLRLVPVSLSAARGFVGRHHDHCPPPVGWRFGRGVRNGPIYVHSWGKTAS